MKTIYKIFYVTFFVLFFTSCIWENKTVINDAKQELWIIQKGTITDNNQDILVEDQGDKKIEDQEWIQIKEEKKRFEIIKLTQDQLLEFDNI